MEGDYEMTDIEKIRKKHERDKVLVMEKRPQSYLFAQSELSISEVDALFRELDEARGKVERAISACNDSYSTIKGATQRIEQIMKGGKGDE